METKRPRGRPQKYNIEEMVDIICEYTDNTVLPILKEVCYLNGWNFDTLMNLERQNEDLNWAIKRLLQKKEVEVERGGLIGKYNQTMAVFTLKQLGWKDKQDIELNTSDNDLEVKINVVSPSQEDIDRVKKLKEGLFKNDN